MYKDKKPFAIHPAILTVMACILILFLLFAIARPDQEILSEGCEDIKNAVMRIATQCYAVEGVYPPNLEYLEENYGLRVNKDAYYIVYTAFASNLPPTVRVVAKE